MSDPITRKDMMAVLTRRGSRLARRSPHVNQRIRELRWIAKRRGEIELPSWFWTATQDKALIDFVRANPVYFPGYWKRAATIARGCGAAAAQERWRALRAKGVPLPSITHPVWHRWTAEKLALIAEMLKTHTRDEIADEFDVSRNAINKVIRNYGLEGQGGVKPRRASFTPQQLADIELAEKTWAEFEAKGEK